MGDSDSNQERKMVQMQNPEPEHEEEDEMSQDSLEPSPDRKHFSLLRIDSFKSSTTTTTNNNHDHHQPPSTSSAYASVSGPQIQLPILPSISIPYPNPMKRPSPSHSPPSQPNPKKEKLFSDPFSPAGSFSKISHPLRRCVSDPYNPPAPPATAMNPNPFGGLDSFSGPTGHDQYLQPQHYSSPVRTPPSAKGSAGSFSTLPPRPTLRRSVSDLNPCSAAKTISRRHHTPDSKRLRRIKDRIREMGQLFQQVALEDDQQNGPNDDSRHPNTDQHHYNTDQDDCNTVDTTKSQDVCEMKFEDSVSVEKGECLVIHFRCDCGTPYEFLLAGGNCYYRLM